MCKIVRCAQRTRHGIRIKKSACAHKKYLHNCPVFVYTCSAVTLFYLQTAGKSQPQDHLYNICVAPTSKGHSTMRIKNKFGLAALPLRNTKAKAQKKSCSSRGHRPTGFNAVNRRLALILLFASALAGCVQSPRNELEDARDRVVTYYTQRSSHGYSLSEAVAVLSLHGLDTSVSDLLAIDEMGDLTTEDVCYAIYLLEGSGADSRNYNGRNMVLHLSSRQGEDGSFGTLEETLFSALTLENVGATYDRDGVLRLLIAAQRPEGEFSNRDETEGNLALTGKVLSFLGGLGEDTRAATMRQRAIEYLTRNEQAIGDGALDTAALSALLMGLSDNGVSAEDSAYAALLQALLAHQKEDGQFVPLPGAEPDAQSTASGVMAIDASLRGGSLWNSMMQRDSSISIEIRVLDRQIYYGSHLRLHEGDTVLEATSRFCAVNGIPITYRLGIVLSFGDVGNNIAQTWQAEVNKIAVDGAFVLSSGDSVVWTWK